MTDYFELIGYRNYLRPEPGVSIFADRVRAWEAVFDRWLSGLRSKEGRRKYLHIWVEFLNFGTRPPWERDAAYVERWEEHLHQRGWSPRNLYTYRRTLASFYRFAFREREAGELQAMLALPDENPLPDRDPQPSCAGCSPDRFFALSPGPPDRYLNAHALEPREVSDLFEVIDVDSPFGRRDYALFLTCLAAGVEKRCICALRWGDIEVEGGRAWYRWRGRRRGASETALLRRSPLPACAWQAIQEYLDEAGRLDDMRPEDCVFTPLFDMCGTFNPAGDPDWQRARPLYHNHAGRILSVYARWAGLDPGRATFPALRYTSILLRAHAGQSVQTIQDELGIRKHRLMRLIPRLRAQDGPGDWSEVISELGLSFA